MTQISQPFSLAEQQNAAATLLSSTLLNTGTETLLGLQADFLVGMESAMTEWLHRRHEAVLDTKRLIARIRESQDVNELLRAHQEWMAGSFRRMAADASSFQSALMFANRIGREAEEKSRIVAEAGASTAASASPKLQPANAGRAPAANEASEKR
jgi:hypothetical protein